MTFLQGAALFLVGVVIGGGVIGYIWKKKAVQAALDAAKAVVK